MDLILPESCVTKQQPKIHTLRTNVVFYRWPKQANRLTVGFPEQYPSPAGAVKVICRTAREVERYSAEMRTQELEDREKNAIERDAFEGSIRAENVRHMRTLLANARNETNAKFLQKAIDRTEEKAAQPEKFESYMHAEAFEQGK